MIRKRHLRIVALFILILAVYSMVPGLAQAASPDTKDRDRDQGVAVQEGAPVLPPSPCDPRSGQVPSGGPESSQKQCPINFH